MVPRAHPNQHPIRPLDRFSRFCRYHKRDQQTDRQTDQPCYSVYSNRPPLLDAILPKNRKFRMHWLMKGNQTDSCDTKWSISLRHMVMVQPQCPESTATKEAPFTLPPVECKVLWLCVCLSVCSHIPKITQPNFTKFSVHVTCGRGMVYLWHQCYVLQFLACDAKLARYMLLSHVRPSRASIVPKRLNIVSCKQRYMIARGL